MNGWLALTQLCLLAFVFFASSLGATFAASYPLWRAPLARIAPTSRVRWLRLLAAAPLLVSLGLVALCFVPSLIGADDCVNHDDVHAHFCFLHRMIGPGGFYGWVVLGTCGLIVTRHAAHGVRPLIRAHHVVSGLRNMAQPDAGFDAWLLETPVAMSFAAGVFKPDVYVSRGMLSAFGRWELLAVVEHERAHVRRRDTLWRLATRMFALPYALVPSRREQLLRDLDLAVEQACDEDAAIAVGDRLTVAEALLRCARALNGAAMDSALVSGFANRGDVAARVEALAAEPVTRTIARSPITVTAVVVCGIALCAANDLHEAAETVLGFLTR
jgi:hypothetical protein